MAPHLWGSPRRYSPERRNTRGHLCAVAKQYQKDMEEERIAVENKPFRLNIIHTPSHSDQFRWGQIKEEVRDTAPHTRSHTNKMYWLQFIPKRSREWAIEGERESSPLKWILFVFKASVYVKWIISGLNYTFFPLWFTTKITQSPIYFLPVWIVSCIALS